MEEQDKASGEGSSVDPANMPAGDQRMPLSDTQVESDFVLRGNRISLDPPVEVAEEVKEDNQNTDWTHENQLQAILLDLKQVMTKDHFQNAERVVQGVFLQTPAVKLSLLELLKYVYTLHQKPDKASRTWFSSMWSTVRVFCEVTGETCGAHDSILKQVKKCGKYSITKLEVTSHLQDCDIIILFCPIASRVGTDVDTAMRRISGDKRVLLVLMHHTRDIEYSVDVKRWSETYKNVVLDVHVLFHETVPGLLQCTRNDDAVQQIYRELYSKDFR